MIIILGSLPPPAHAEEVPGDGAVPPEVPVLVALVPVTVEHQDGQAQVVLGVLLVQAELVVEVSYLSGSDDGVLKETRHLVAEVPVKPLALQRLSQLSPLRHVSELTNVLRPLSSSLAQSVVVELLVLVHPDFRHSLVVVLGELHLGCPLVRGEGPEDVTNSAAGNNLNLTATHPGLEAELKVLSAPDVKPS